MRCLGPDQNVDIEGGHGESQSEGFAGPWGVQRGEMSPMQEQRT